MLGLDMDSILSKLMQSEDIKKVVKQATDVCNGIVLAITHFNSRFDALEFKVDKVIIILEHSSNIAPAAPDGLLQLLAENGQEMKQQTVEPLPSNANPDGSIN
jgi:hypothetical protein